MFKESDKIMELDEVIFYMDFQDYMKSCGNGREHAWNIWGSAIGKMVFLASQTSASCHSEQCFEEVPADDFDIKALFPKKGPEWMYEAWLFYCHVRDHLAAPSSKRVYGISVTKDEYVRNVMRLYLEDGGVAFDPDILQEFAEFLWGRFSAACDKKYRKYIKMKAFPSKELVLIGDKSAPLWNRIPAFLHFLEEVCGCRLDERHEPVWYLRITGLYFEIEDRMGKDDYDLFYSIVQMVCSICQADMPDDDVIFTWFKKHRVAEWVCGVPDSLKKDSDLFQILSCEHTGFDGIWINVPEEILLRNARRVDFLLYLARYYMKHYVEFCHKAWSEGNVLYYAWLICEDAKEKGFFVSWDICYDFGQVISGSFSGGIYSFLDKYCRGFSWRKHFNICKDFLDASEDEFPDENGLHFYLAQNTYQKMLDAWQVCCVNCDTILSISENRMAEASVDMRGKEKGCDDVTFCEEIGCLNMRHDNCLSRDVCDEQYPRPEGCPLTEDDTDADFDLE